MKTVSKVIIIVALLVMLGIGLFGILSGRDNSNSGINEPNQQPHYLTYKGVSTKIYFLSSGAGYVEANSTYTATEGRVVQKGTRLLEIQVVLRNDYTSDSPPPANKVPMSPADGTAYLFMSAQLFNQKGRVNATNVSLSDFSLPDESGNGLVLASGQTGAARFWVLSDETNVDHYDLSLVFLGDSIPT